MDMKSKFMSPDFVPTELSEHYYEYESGKKGISVVGSLARHANYWQKIGAPEYILNIIKNGYTIPLKYILKRKALGQFLSSKFPTTSRLRPQCTKIKLGTSYDSRMVRFPL